MRLVALVICCISSGMAANIAAAPRYAAFFPPMSWQDAAVGVVFMPRAPIGGDLARSTTIVPDPTRLATARAEWLPLVSPKARAAHEAKWGDKEKAVARDTAATEKLVTEMRVTAAQFEDVPERSILSVRAAQLSLREPLAFSTIRGACAEALAALWNDTPAEVLQRAEILSAVAEAANGQAQAGEWSQKITYNEAAARGWADVALLQFRLTFLDETTQSLALAQRYADATPAGAAQLEILAKMKLLQQVIDEERKSRTEYLRLIAAVAKPSPEQAAANRALAILLLKRGDLKDAIAPAAASNDRILQALSDAAENRNAPKGEATPEGQARRIALGLTTIAERLSPQERTIIASLALEWVNQFERLAPNGDARAAYAKLYRGKLVAMRENREDSITTQLAGGFRSRGIGSNVGLLGAGPAPQRLAMVCDASGSMMTKFDTLRNELDKAFKTLKPDQELGLIFFAENSTYAVNKTLVPASPGNIKAALDFLGKMTCHGSSDPVPALRAAFATDPEVICFLSDGDTPDNQAVLDEIHKLNAGRKKRVRINTIAFLDPDEAYQKFLQQMAAENGGYFRFVGE